MEGLPMEIVYNIFELIFNTQKYKLYLNNRLISKDIKLIVDDISKFNLLHTIINKNKNYLPVFSHVRSIRKHEFKLKYIAITTEFINTINNWFASDNKYRNYNASKIISSDNQRIHIFKFKLKHLHRIVRYNTVDYVIININLLKKHICPGQPIGIFDNETKYLEHILRPKVFEKIYNEIHKLCDKYIKVYKEHY
jgi:hypothetical protein